MKKDIYRFKGALIASFAILLFGACDDGRIYPEDNPQEVTGGKGMMQVVFKGEKAWPKEYSLVFAAFGKERRIPVVSKVIHPPSVEGSPVSVTLNGLDEKMKSLDIAVVNKGRELLYTLYSYPIEDATKEITLPINEIYLASFDRIQQQVFDAYCIRCHGAGEYAAADLDLTEKRSYQSLVNAKSLLSNDDLMLVEPNVSSESFLCEILEEDALRYNHTDVLPEAELVDLIKAWITDGAEK